jgi:hypothetical protein
MMKKPMPLIRLFRLHSQGSRILVTIMEHEIFGKKYYGLVVNMEGNGVNF